MDIYDQDGRSTGNRSTEGKIEAALKKAHIRGWKKHPKKDFLTQLPRKNSESVR